MRTKCRPSVFAWLALATVFALAAAVLRAATPETYYYFVFSNPVAGQRSNIIDGKRTAPARRGQVPGFVSARRFVMNDSAALPHGGTATAEVPRRLQDCHQ